MACHLEGGRFGALGLQLGLPFLFGLVDGKAHDEQLISMEEAQSGGKPARLGFLHRDRKSTRLNSSHSQISYAVFCLKKKKKMYPTEHNRTSHNSHHTEISSAKFS